MDYINWQRSPQYLKNLRKIQNMRPEDKAVTQTLISELQGMFAGSEMQARLNSMKLAAQEAQQKRNIESQQARLGLKSQALDTRQQAIERSYGLDKDAYDFMKQQNKTATALGWGNIGLAGLTGYADYRKKKDLTKTLLEQAALYK